MTTIPGRAETVPRAGVLQAEGVPAQDGLGKRRIRIGLRRTEFYDVFGPAGPTAQRALERTFGQVRGRHVFFELIDEQGNVQRLGMQPRHIKGVPILWTKFKEEHVPPALMEDVHYLDPAEYFGQDVDEDVLWNTLSAKRGRKTGFFVPPLRTCHTVAHRLLERAIQPPDAGGVPKDRSTQTPA